MFILTYILAAVIEYVGIFLKKESDLKIYNKITPNYLGGLKNIIVFNDDTAGNICSHFLAIAIYFDPSGFPLSSMATWIPP